jgi:type II secretory ATPase GspE/PulE/Tfp pilus assembly ATPase PilB-like protein
MLGEISDGETAIHAALTGHLLISTLHTNVKLLEAIDPDRTVPRGAKFCKGEGCKKCSGTGFWPDEFRSLKSCRSLRKSRWRSKPVCHTASCTRWR